MELALSFCQYKAKHAHKDNDSIQEHERMCFDGGYHRVGVVVGDPPMWCQGARFRAASCLYGLPVVPEAPGLIPGDLSIFWAQPPGDLATGMILSTNAKLGNLRTLIEAWIK